MLLRTIFTIGIAAGVTVAAPREGESLVSQDMTTMQETFDRIFTGIDNMLVDVNGFKGDEAGIATIIADSNVIEKFITEGTQKVKKSPSMTIPDILTILGPVMVMQDKVGEIVTTLSKKKVELEKAGAAPKILDALRREKAAADGLVSVIISSLPMSSVVGIVANPIAKTITDRLEAGIKEWGGSSSTASKGNPRPKGKGSGGPSVMGLWDDSY
jgi:hypothetical protein